MGVQGTGFWGSLEVEWEQGPMKGEGKKLLSWGLVGAKRKVRGGKSKFLLRLLRTAFTEGWAF